MADLVLWEPAFFGAKPKMVLKGGMIVWSIMGDPNASLPTPQPVYYRPMFGAHGSASSRKTCVTFVSQAAYDLGIGREARPAAAGHAGLRHPHPDQAGHGAQRPYPRRSTVDPETFAVKVDGVHATVPPAKNAPAEPALLLQLTDAGAPADRGDRRKEKHDARRDGARQRRTSPAWAIRLKEATRRRPRSSTSGRPRRTASARRPAGGVELAVALERDTHLRDGDVLAWDEPTAHRGGRPDRAAAR